MAQTNPLEPFMLESRVKRLRQAAGGRIRSLTVVLDGVHDPHNLSAVVRSCEGFGILDLWVIESHARFRVNTKVSQGAEKWLDIHRYRDPGYCTDVLAINGFELWVADPASTSIEVEDLPWDRRIALVFGNEHEGVSSQVERAASGRFRIPMHGFSQSLNISVAAGVALAIGIRQREHKLGHPGDLSQAEQAELVAEWQRRSVKYANKILSQLEHGEENRDASN